MHCITCIILDNDHERCVLITSEMRFEIGTNGFNLVALAMKIIGKIGFIYH